MEKLDNNDITVESAQAQSNLAKQAINILNYEIKRAELMVKLDECNKNGSSIRLREIEGKAFDDTVNR